MNIGKHFEAPQKITETVIKVNKRIKQRMIEKIIQACFGDVTNKVICFLGVTFKPNTDDLREAPSLTIIPSLQRKKAIIRAVDPKGETEGKLKFKKVEWFSSPYLAVKEADCLVILTEWNEFRALNLAKIAKSMKNHI